MAVTTHQSGLDLGTGKVPSVLFQLAAPVMLSLFFENLFYLGDTLFVSWLGTESLAALSLSMPLFYTAFALAKGVSVGTTVLLSHSLGEGQVDRGRRILRAAFPLMLTVMLPWLVLTGQTPCGWVLGLLGAKERGLHEGSRFLFWLVCSFPVMGYFMVAESVCMSYGDSVTPMKGILLGNIVSIGLKYLFIFRCGMGVAGSSLGTCAGWTVSAVYLGSQLARHGRPVPVVALERDIFKRWKGIAGLGSQTALGVVISPVALGLINLVLARMDLAGVAALNLAMRLEFMVIVPLVGLSNALAPFMGFNLGRGEMARIHDGARASVRLGWAIILPVMVGFLLFARPLFWMFRPSDDVLGLAEYALRCSALGYLAVPLELTLQGAAIGLKQPRYAIVATGFRQLLLRVPLVAWLSARYGIHGAFWSLPVSMALSGALCLWLLRRLLDRTRSSLNPTRNALRPR